MFSYTAKQKEAIKLIKDPAYTEIYLYGGARSSKTFTFLSQTILRALEAPNTSHCVCRYEQVDCRKTVFNQTLDKINKIVFNGELFGETNREKDKLGFKAKGTTELRLKNGSYIAFLGVNGNANLEKILGSEWSTIFINEASEISPGSYYTLRTRLAEKSSLDNKMFLDANPPPKRHWLYKRYILHLNTETGKPLQDDIDFVSLKMNPSDNKEYIPPTYYKRMSSTDQPEAWRKRFFLGEYAENLEGAVFKEELKDLDQQGRETEIPFVKSEPITAVLDIGQTTACWLAYINVLKERVELIDYIEAYGVSVKWMLDKIKFLGYRLGLVVLPHDASPASHQTGTSVVEEYRSYAQKMGFEVSILPKSKWGDNINALRKWFPRFWFNASSTSVGMDAIRNYEYSGFASSSGNVDNVKPRHNWASHAADALKYVALWCGRDYDFLKTSATPISKYGVHSDIRYIKNAEWKKKEDEHWIIENLIEEWRRIRDEDYW